MLDELEDNVVSRVIQAVGLFGDILSLEDTMEPILSVSGPERLQNKEAEDEDESKKRSDEQNNEKIEQEGLRKELKNGKVEEGKGRGDLVEMEVRTDDHKVELGEEQEKSVAAGREDQTSAEIKGDMGCSEGQEEKSQCQIEEEDQVEMEKHCEVSGGTVGEDRKKARGFKGEREEEQEREMAVREQRSDDDEVESRGGDREEQLVEEGREEEGPREVQMVKVDKDKDKAQREVPAGMQDGENVAGQEEAAKGKECEVEGKDQKLKVENPQKGKEIEKISEEDEEGVEEETELDKEEEDKRQEDVKSKGQGELPIKPGIETMSKDDQQWEDDGVKTMIEEDFELGLECEEQNNEKKEGQEQNGSTEQTGSVVENEKKEAGKEDETEEVIRPQEKEEQESKQRPGGKEKNRDELEQELIASSTAPETGRGREVLDAVPAIEEGSKPGGKHSHGVYPASLGQHNDPIEEEGEEKCDDEDESEEDQEAEKEETPDRTQLAPLRDADVDSARATQETSEQVDKQLRAATTSLPAAPEPMSGKLVPYMKPLKWMYLKFKKFSLVFLFFFLLNWTLQVNVNLN